MVYKVSQILGPSAGRRTSPASKSRGGGSPNLLATLTTPIKVKASAENRLSVLSVQDAAETRVRRSGEEKMASAWGLEFEAEALAAQGETRFLQAEIHRLLAERASEQVATGRSMAELEATIAWLQASREHDRNVMRDARENVEAATNRLSEGYEVRLAQLDADRAALAEQVCQLEMEIQNLHGNHLQDIQAHRSWHSSALDTLFETRGSELACLAMRAWRELLRGKDAGGRRRHLAGRVTARHVQEIMLQAKRALWAAWSSAAVRRAQHRRSAGAVTKAVARLSDGESRRRRAFVAWRMAVHPLRGSAQKALAHARLATVQHRQQAAHREFQRSCWDIWASNAREEARRRELEAASTALRDQVAMHKEAAQAAHASAEERLQQVELQFQESEMIAAEASSQQLLDQKLVSAKLESRLSTASEREEELRHEMSRLADLLTAAEAEVLEKTSDVENAEERLAAKTAEAHAFEQAELRQHTQEAAIAGRLARLVQQAADQEEEIAVLQTSLHAERAALAVLRRSELQITDAVTEAKSLPVRHVRTDVDEAKNRWRLEHSFSVSAIHKSGTLPETLPLASRTKRLASRSQ
ncbi:unnamed protein product [Symbiodinium necroappetens]|uniref:Uncharacterized protein n=1 Tax=Symbiodinium necroappetens TaxID=1628268 RepID=A0A813AU03_9DINO|nr:unnamed protein product [Symbiodinium necroappetens]